MNQYAITDPLERFWAKVDKSDPDGCWPYTGARIPRGYGVFFVGPHRGMREYAHRFSLRLKIGRQLVAGEYACHTCDNPPCCNPAHLFVGDSLSNVRDMIAKGRDVYGVYQRERPWLMQHGTARYNARLDPDKVRDIRRRGMLGEKPDDIGAVHGVHRATVIDVLKGVTWKHVTGEGSG